MIRNIIREVPYEQSDFSFYFDDDGLTSKGGNCCYNLFIVSNDGWGRKSGFNMDEYKKVVEQAEGINEGFYDVVNRSQSWNNYLSYKEVMRDWYIDYSPSKCHKLKEWYNKYSDVDDAESIAEFLTITTGEQWGSCRVRGYSQGDMVDVIYCKKYNNQPEAYGEIYLGCGKEFCVIDLDEDGNEIESCCGYIVADSQAYRDEEYKKLVCEWAGIEEEETQLEMIDGYHTVTNYDYRVA